MKKLTLLAAAICSIAVVHAQPNSWLIYGSAGFSQNSSNNNYVGTNTSWSVAPGIGYQFNKHLTVGVQGSYSHAENPLASYPMVFTPGISNYNGYYGGTTINWTAGAFFRYTQSVGKIFFLYGQANMSYISSQVQNAQYYYYPLSASVYNEPSSSPANGFQAQIFPAIGAKVYKGLALNFSIGGINYYTVNQQSDVAGSNRTNNIELTFGQQINIGVSDNLSFRKHSHKHHHSETVSGAEYRHVDNSGTEEDDVAPATDTKKHHKHKKAEKEEDAE